MKVDVHCHLCYQEYFKKDIASVVERAKKNNFTAIIDNGLNVETNRIVLENSKKFPLIKPALGLYPSHILEMSDKEIAAELKFIESSKPFAIGEVGLDLFKTENIERQTVYFKKFVELAKKLNVPLLIHSRKAEQQVLEVLQELKPKKAVMHCFGGNSEQTTQAINLGCYFSIPPSIVKNKGFKKLVKRIPLDKILTETDAPYLSPYEDKKRNEPSFIVETIKKIAEIKHLTVEETEKIIFMNYQRLFMK